MVNKTKKKKKKSKLPWLLLIIGVSIGIYVKSEYDEIVGIKNDISKTIISENKDEIDTNFLKAFVPDNDSTSKTIHLSDSNAKPEYYFDTLSGKYIKKVYTGRRINIALTGVDSRLGDRYKHADANHIISILLDSGQIEIISIPRDTPADAGFDDTTGQNKLTIVRANRGRKAYFGELCRIGDLDKIHYFAELGFSQAMGIIEFLGFDNPNETLQILRSRTALGGDDYQRVYNQAQFIRQMLFKNFDRLSGPLGDVLIGSGLIILDSDLSTDKIKEIITELKKKNFTRSIDNIRIKIRPAFPAKFKVYDFADKNTVNTLSNKVRTYFEHKYSEVADSGSPSTSKDINRRVYNRLTSALNKSTVDTAKNPQRVISSLTVLFEQRAWLQIAEKDKRKEIRDKFVNLLSYSYEKRKDTVSAKKIRSVATAEDNLLNVKN
jgi:anionic cell wall polymer biosynthesis LytR-Cps2A-Psr (LCP) family protein